METPSSDTNLEIRIDNYHVNFRSLNPSSCYLGYFKNQTVLDLLFKVIFEQHTLYRRREKGFGFLGPGQFVKIPNLPVYFFMALTWTAILFLAIWLF